MRPQAGGYRSRRCYWVRRRPHSFSELEAGRGRQPPTPDTSPLRAHSASQSCFREHSPSRPGVPSPLLPSVGTVILLPRAGQDPGRAWERTGPGLGKGPRAR